MSDLKYKVNSRVQWKWMGRPIVGVVEEIFLGRVERVIKGKKICRNGSKAVPAYLVKSEAGNHALKLHSELTPAPVFKSKMVPRMFSDSDD